MDDVLRNSTRELAMLRALQHPNVVGLVDELRLSNGGLQIVMVRAAAQETQGGGGPAGGEKRGWGAVWIRVPNVRKGAPSSGSARG
eukprot:351382-Chlamydomonas_euryale.AAC.1